MGEEEIKEIEIDEMWHYLNKKNKRSVFKAYDRHRKRVIAWVIGDRSMATIQKLYEKLEHLKNGIF